MYKLIFLISFVLVQCSSSDYKSLYKRKPANYSYIIKDIETDRIYKEYNSEIYLSPASCQKIITALVALKYLGTDYRYETKLYSNDDIVISFSGDPSLTSDDLISLLRIVENKKYRKIILDSSIFQTSPHSKNIMIDDIGSYYARPVNSINIDDNIVNITIKPNKIGEITEVIPDLSYDIDSLILTSNDKTSIKMIWDGEKIKASGNININDKSYTYKISPNDIDIYVNKKINKILKKLNIEGNVEIIKDNNIYNKTNLINSIYSKYLKDNIIPAMKKSDNLFFDSLYLKIINSYNSTSVEDWDDGNLIFKNLIIKYFDVDINDAKLVDGSGLSRYNKIQLKNIIRLLDKSYNIPEFIRSLPSPHEKDTTLYKRNILSDDIIAKTGNMSSISCLCGYNINSNKSFAIIANDFIGPYKEMFDIIDDFISNNTK